MISERTQPGTITLTATNAIGATRRYDLRPDQGVFVGRSANCGLQLHGEGLSDIHCRIALEEGNLWVQDWMSANGTVVNGETISTKLEFRRGDVIRIGEHRIEVADPNAPVRSSATEAKANEAEHAYQAEESLDTYPPVETDSPIDEPSIETDDVVGSDVADVVPTANDDMERIQMQLAELTPADQPVDAAADDLGAEATQSVEFDEDPFAFEFDEETTYDSETIALLQAEIEDLQTALCNAMRISATSEQITRIMRARRSPRRRNPMKC